MGSADIEFGDCEQYNFGKYLKVLPTNDQIKELQTILRDR